MNTLEYIFFHFFCFCIFNGQNTDADRIKLCEMVDRVHQFEDQIKYIIYDMKVLTVCAVNYVR